MEEKWKVKKGLILVKMEDTLDFFCGRYKKLCGKSEEIEHIDLWS